MPGRYIPDILSNGFEQQRVALGHDYEGEVVFTLVRKLCDKPSTKAVLYVHGFYDYFFQQEMALRFIEQGYNFYAVDLRKCGRSILPHQTPYDMRDVSEYFAELDTANMLIREEGSCNINLCAHSTGGLIAACYLHQRGTGLYDALVLNSPFLDISGGSLVRRLSVSAASFAAKFFPDKKLKASFSPFYGESLHVSKRGEWDYRTDWKPIRCKEISLGWLRAVNQAHKSVRRGLNVACPVLVLASGKSRKGDVWINDFHYCDLVLDVDGIHYYANKLGENVSTECIFGGKHDLFLSREPIRSEAYDYVFDWLHGNQ